MQEIELCLAKGRGDVAPESNNENLVDRLHYLLRGGILYIMLYVDESMINTAKLVYELGDCWL